MGARNMPFRFFLFLGRRFLRVFYFSCLTASRRFYFLLVTHKINLETLILSLLTGVFPPRTGSAARVSANCARIGFCSLAAHRQSLAMPRSPVASDFF